MNAKSKAIELVQKYHCQIIDTVKFKKAVSLNEAKAFALIAVNEIQEHLLVTEACFDKELGEIGNFKKWSEVKDEIKKL
jgi:hypothetical protein